MYVFKNVSIKQKLIRISLFTAGLALMLSAVALIINEVIEVKKSLLKELTVQTEIIGINSAAALTFNDEKAAMEVLSALRANRNIDLASIYTKAGTLFAQYSREGKKHDLPRRRQNEDHRFGLNYVEVYHDIVLEKEIIGFIYIHSNLNELYGNIVSQTGLFLAVILLSLLAAYALSSGLQKTITVPISDLVRTMSTVSEEKDYSVRALVQNKDELGALSEGFNEMLTQIQARDSELETYRKNLEELVERRTGELRTANDQLQRELTEHAKAEKEVQRLNEELEMKVEERTRELLDAQEELVLKEKLATLGQLSGSVGHELRNPMGVISNAVYFLQSVMPDADETVKEYLNIIKSEVINSERIISDLLDFTRTKTPQTEVITVNALIKQSLGKCIVPQNISLRVEIPDTLPAVKIDPFQMGQVFYNLVTNAIQAMPNGGELRIAARKVVRDWGLGVSKEGIEDQKLGIGGENLNPNPQQPTPEEDFIEISVTDTGEGISPGNMKKLFQPLFTTKARGIGLGLTVVKNLIEANGGRIEVDSQTGKGTTFTVILPTAGKGQ